MTHLTRPVLAFLTCLLIMGLTACATVQTDSQDRETKDLGAVANDALALAQKLGPQNVLVVFDIDNTILAMEQGLGADQWYEWQKELSAEHPCDPRVVSDRLAVQGALYFASAMRPTQEDAASLTREIQTAGIPVIALTSRGADFRLQTFRELRRNDFDFRRTGLEPATGWPENFVPKRGSRPARYEDGVFLTAGQHKGEMLLELLERTGTKMPAAIVMADDKRSNLDDVIEAMGPLGVTVRTWRYSGEDDQVAGFDPTASDQLWRTLEPALHILQKHLGPDNYSLPEDSEKECAS